MRTMRNSRHKNSYLPGLELTQVDVNMAQDRIYFFAPFAVQFVSAPKGNSKIKTALSNS